MFVRGEGVTNNKLRRCGGHHVSAESARIKIARALGRNGILKLTMSRIIMHARMRDCGCRNCRLDARHAGYRNSRIAQVRPVTGTIDTSFNISRRAGSYRFIRTQTRGDEAELHLTSVICTPEDQLITVS